MTEGGVHPSRIIIAGIILLAVGVTPLEMVAADQHDPYLSDPPSYCKDPPTRPVNDSVENPDQVGEISRYQQNQSLIKIEYTATNTSKERDFSVSLPDRSSIVRYSENLQKVSNSTLEQTKTADKYWMVYNPGTAYRGGEYPSTNDWVFAPTPEHDQEVRLEPAGTGYIGQKILFLGEYSTHQESAGCQNFIVIEPAGSEFNTQKKLGALASSSHLLDFGESYSTVRIFAAPYIKGDLSGFVPRFENEILLEGGSSVNSPQNVWVHEYVHTRQWGSGGGALSWLNEGAATYFAARTSLELGLISPLEYDRWLDSQQSYNPDTTLSEARHKRVAYKWGSVILAESAARAYKQGSEQTFEQEYGEIIQYSISDYGKFNDSLNRLELNQSHLNQTRSAVFQGIRPVVDYGYQTQVGSKAGLVLSIQDLSAQIGAVLIILGAALRAQEIDLRNLPARLL